MDEQVLWRKASSKLVKGDEAEGRIKQTWKIAPFERKVVLYRANAYETPVWPWDLQILLGYLRRLSADVVSSELISELSLAALFKAVEASALVHLWVFLVFPIWIVISFSSSWLLDDRKVGLVPRGHVVPSRGRGQRVRVRMRTIT